MMKDQSHPVLGRFKSWSVLGVLLVCLVLVVGLVAVGCGDDRPADEATATSSGETTTTSAAAGGESTEATSAAEDVDPSELADTIVATWAEAIQALDALLEGEPDAAAVKADVEALKEEYIQKFVEQGTIMAAMSDSDQASVQDKVSADLGDFAGETWYLTYLDNWDHYSYASGDVEFVNLLADFNMLSDYSDFELLKSEDPEEAARLGID